MPSTTVKLCPRHYDLAPCRVVVAKFLGVHSGFLLDVEVGWQMRPNKLAHTRGEQSYQHRNDSAQEQEADLQVLRQWLKECGIGTVAWSRPVFTGLDFISFWPMRGWRCV
jgi:hypothetical protein